MQSRRHGRPRVLDPKAPVRIEQVAAIEDHQRTNVLRPDRVQATA